MIAAVRTVMVLGLVGIAAGCYESTEVTQFEPGIYKGESDPLLSTDAGERAAELEERFNTVQTDR